MSNASSPARLSSRDRGIQTWALLVAAYRELNARKLFWLSIVLSGLVVLSIGALGLDEDGITIFAWTLESPFFNSTVVAPETFYKLLFSNLGVQFWLGLGATILALVSTAGIIPDLVTAGTIDMMVSKPLGRTRLFLTKYATGLLFTALQVTVFTVACFLVIGIRGGAWEFGLLIAIPLVVLFYSYLYCVCALVGLLTRSTVASLLLTMIFWFLVFGLQSAEQLVSVGRTASRLELDAISQDLEAERSHPDGADAPEVERLEEELAAQRSDDDTWQLVYAPISWLSAALPKTGETLSLLERSMDDVAAMPGQWEEQRAERRADRRSARGEDARPRPDDGAGPGGEIFGSSRVGGREIENKVAEERAARSKLYVIGTSLLFEAFILAIACWRFRRRDF
ncbi:MAG: ABC transporter permease [Planctomycetota bacterium]|nr:ABC transporter permease [Planctomycetota bacterium]MDA1106184.1 ABC transporter permease [Planctomycetota bacterium]